MRGIRLAALIAVIAVAHPAAPSDLASVPAALQILGSVRDAARPVSNALVIALNLESFVTTQTWSSSDGTFSLPPLKAGVYKVIAVKSGFVPAVATILPTAKTSRRVTLRLETSAKAKTKEDEIWEIRGSLPPDILREIDQVLTSPAQAAAAYNVPRLKGQMMSMTGMAAARQAESPAFAQTGIGVQSRIGDSWQLGFRGDLQRFEDPTADQAFSDPVAQSSAMSMELRSSSTDSYRVNSTHATWRYNDSIGDEPPADLRSHNFEWEHGASTVRVHYFAHDNFFRPAFGSDVIEVAGDTPILQTQHNDIGVSLRVRQESVRANSADTLRTANVAANGTFDVASSIVLHYGMSSRLAFDRTEWAPSTGAEWKLTRNTALIGSATYKVLNTSPATPLPPSLVAWSDDVDVEVLPRYSYSVGIVSTRDEHNRLSAIATVSAADAPLRVLITDGTQQFWDTLVVDTGDVRRDLRLAYRHDFGSRFAVDISTAAGTATPRQFSRDPQEKVYVTGDMQTIFAPTRTTLAVSYRGIQQPQHAGGNEYRSSRVNVRLAQSLYLPIDMNLLIGFELVRAQNSPFLLDTLLPEETSRKYIGGLAVNF